MRSRGTRWLIALGFLGACGGQTLADLESQPEPDAGGAGNTGAAGHAGAAGDSGAGNADAGFVDAGGDVMQDAGNANDSLSGDSAGELDVTSDGPITGGFGVGFAGHPDALGDVTRPASDVLEVAVYVSADWLDFRVRFADTPLQPDATNDVGWCLDLNQDELTGVGCVGMSGPYLIVDYYPNSTTPYHVFFGDTELDPCTHVGYEGSTRTLRIVVARSVLADDGVFDYAITSNFGGSFGVWDTIPDPPTPFLTSVLVDELPPFSVGPSCSPPWK